MYQGMYQVLIEWGSNTTNFKPGLYNHFREWMSLLFFEPYYEFDFNETILNNHVYLSIMQLLQKI